MFANTKHTPAVRMAKPVKSKMNDQQKSPVDGGEDAKKNQIIVNDFDINEHMMFQYGHLGKAHLACLL